MRQHEANNRVLSEVSVFMYVCIYTYIHTYIHTYVSAMDVEDLLNG